MGARLLAMELRMGLAELRAAEGLTVTTTCPWKGFGGGWIVDSMGLKLSAMELRRGSTVWRAADGSMVIT